MMTTAMAIMKAICLQATSARIITVLLTETAMAVKTVMAMVQVIHRMSAELAGTLIKVQTYGSMIQPNGLTQMVMDMVTMERLEQQILISSQTISLQLMIMIQMVILIGGPLSITERML